VSNDLTTVSGSLALGGTLNVITSPAFDLFGSRTYRVFNYATSGTGSLSGSMAIGSTPDANYLYSVNTATAGQVNLFVQRREAAGRHTCLFAAIVWHGECVCEHGCVVLRHARGISRPPAVRPSA